MPSLRDRQALSGARAFSSLLSKGPDDTARINHVNGMYAAGIRGCQASRDEQCKQRSTFCHASWQIDSCDQLAKSRIDPDNFPDSLQSQEVGLEASKEHDDDDPSERSRTGLMSLVRARACTTGSQAESSREQCRRIVHLDGRGRESLEALSKMKLDKTCAQAERKAYVLGSTVCHPR